MTTDTFSTFRATLSLVLIGTVLNGCSDLDEALNTEPKRRVAAVPGIASTADIHDVQKAAGGNSPTAPAAQPAAQPATDTKPAPRQTFIGRTTAQVIDYKLYRTNPFIIVVDNKVRGSDPLTIAATAYVAATSRASALNFKRQLDIIKASKGRAPTFAEFQRLQKQLKIELAKLPRYQAYAYDESTGGLLVIENKQFKIQLYRQAGIPIEAGDKKYEQKLKSAKPQ
ncbi:hypothetical protein OAJ60_02610 [Planctomycetaceae bacterium]|nr:hypothetical protein [Planctomycetaceae bacterium]